MVSYLLKTMKLVLLIVTSAFFFAMLFKILTSIETDYLGAEYIASDVNNNDAIGFFVTAYSMDQKTKY